VAARRRSLRPALLRGARQLRNRRPRRSLVRRRRRPAPPHPRPAPPGARRSDGGSVMNHDEMLDQATAAVRDEPLDPAARDAAVERVRRRLAAALAAEPVAGTADVDEY